MPNHVSNRIKMKGIRNLPLFSVDEGGNEYFDFNKLILMPESLHIESGSVTDESIICYLTEYCTVPIMCLDDEKTRICKETVTNICSKGELSWAKELFHRVMEKLYKMNRGEKVKMYENGKIYVSNYMNYGATTWYDWSRNHWGTKWNAYRYVAISEDEIEFQTAWSAPTPVIEKLAEMYPDVEIEHYWADEDMGNNSGYCHYYKGDISGGYDETDQEAYEHYVMCWGETSCLYKDEDGEWQRRSCDNCTGCD